jgi:hypothetical protein
MSRREFLLNKGSIQHLSREFGRLAEASAAFEYKNDNLKKDTGIQHVTLSKDGSISKCGS